jgi:sugar phosphate isomerase/epimerase
VNNGFARREFLTKSALAAVGTGFFSQTFAAERKPGPKEPSVRLGGPSFAKTDDPEGLALAHRKLGYSAAYCPNIPLTDTDRIRAVTSAFAKHDVVIAEVGRWVNLLDPDGAKRKKNLEVVTEGLALAEAVGARCCVDIAGSFNDKVWYGPHRENLSKNFFDAIVENARKIIDAVKPTRTTFSYEMMGWSIPDTPQRYLKLIRAIDRKQFSVHLDPCNIVNSPEKFYRNTDLLNDCFDKLGKWIASCHAKDLRWEVEMNMHFREVIPGQGALDYKTYLQRLAKLPQQPPLMLEHLSKPEEYEQGRDYILEMGTKAGVAFA